jgi:hypothetical protein
MIALFTEEIHMDDRRYTMRLRNLGGFTEDTQIPLSVAGEDEPLGVWDKVEKRFVKRDPTTKEWVPET